MALYYAVYSTTGDPRMAGIHLTTSSAQHALQSWSDGAHCQPFNSIKEAMDCLVNHVTVAASQSVIENVSTHSVDTQDDELVFPKKRKVMSATSKAQNRKNDQKWEDNYLRLKQFTEEIADGNAQLAMESAYQRPDLSCWVQRQREIYRSWKQGHYENSPRAVDHQRRFLRLLELGVKLDSPPISQWQKMANRWKNYCLPRGRNVASSPRIPSLTIDNPDPELRELYRWQTDQQEEYESIAKEETQRVHLYPHRYKLLLEWNFPFPTLTTKKEQLDMIGFDTKVARKTFAQRLDEFVAYKEKHGTPFVPTNEPGGLGQWCQKLRQRSASRMLGHVSRDGISLSDHNIERLREVGFSFEQPNRGRPASSMSRAKDKTRETEQPKRNRSFDDRLQEFIAWKNKNGTALVPQSLKGLGDWVHSQRRQYAKRLKGETSCMSEDRISKLLAAGFIFDGNGARKQEFVGKQESQSGSSERHVSPNIETALAANQVLALGYSDPSPALGWI